VGVRENKNIFLSEVRGGGQVGSKILKCTCTLTNFGARG
jgi:hypothetical protein